MLQHNITTMLASLPTRSHTPLYAAESQVGALPPAYFQAIAPLHDLVQRLRTSLSQQPFLHTERLIQDSVRHLSHYAEANPHPLYSLSIHQGDLRLPHPYPHIIQLDYSPATIDMAISGIVQVDDTTALRHLLHRTHYIKSVLAMLATTDTVGTAQALGQNLTRQASLLRGLTSAQTLINALTPNNHNNQPSKQSPVDLSKNVSGLSQVITELKAQPQLTPYLPILHQLATQVAELPRDIPALPIATLAGQSSGSPVFPPTPSTTPSPAAAAVTFSPTAMPTLSASLPAESSQPTQPADIPTRLTIAASNDMHTLPAHEYTSTTPAAVMTTPPEAAVSASVETVSVTSVPEATSDALTASTISVVPLADTTSVTETLTTAPTQEPALPVTDTGAPTTVDTVTTVTTASSMAGTVIVTTQEARQFPLTESIVVVPDIPATHIDAQPNAAVQPAIPAVQSTQGPMEATPPVRAEENSTPHDSTPSTAHPPATVDSSTPPEAIHAVPVTAPIPPAEIIADRSVMTLPETTTDSGVSAGEHIVYLSQDPTANHKTVQFHDAAEHICGEHCPIHGKKTHVADASAETTALPTVLEFGTSSAYPPNTNTTPDTTHNNEAQSLFRTEAEHICGGCSS